MKSFFLSLYKRKGKKTVAVVQNINNGRSIFPELIICSESLMTAVYSLM